MSGAAAIGSMFAPIVGAGMGEAKSRGERSKSDEYRRKVLEELAGIKNPEFQDYGGYLENYDGLSNYDPESIVAQAQGDSQMQGINLDPEVRARQMAALEGLSDVADGGMTAEDEARLAGMQGDVSRVERGQRDAIKQNMAMRGMGGSGMELAAQLSNNQAATDRRSQEALDIEGMAQKRALQALMASGDMSGQMRGQEFDEQARKAQAQDAINRFNTQNRMQSHAANVGARNQAQGVNRGYAQQKIDQRNNSRDYDQQNVGRNNDLNQQRYDNDFRKTSTMADAYGNAAANHSNNARQTQAAYTQGGQAVGEGMSSYAKYDQNERRNKAKYGDKY